MMRILLHDASVLIDLLTMDLLDDALSLPYEMETTDLVINEIKDANQSAAVRRAIDHRALLVVESDASDLDQLAQMRQANARLSLSDCSVIHWARNHSAIVLSGDATLCQIARSEGLEAHGTLWVLRELVEKKLAKTDRMAESLCRLMTLNPRLPAAECQRLIAEWRRQ